MLGFEKTFAIIISVLLLEAVSSVAQIPLLEDRLTASGEARLRSEFDSKNFNSAIDANQFSLLRTRIGLGVILADDVTAFIQFQDSRTFGQEISTLANDANIGLHQSFITFNNLFGLKDLSIAAGRMEISFGGERLVGAVNWHNVGRSFDGARLVYNSEKARLEFWTAKLAENFQDGDDQDQSIHGLDLELKALPAFKPRGYLIVETNGGKNAVGDNLLNRQTIGVQILGQSSGFSYDLETAKQIGDLAGSHIDASLLAVSAGYIFNYPAKPRFSTGIDYLSGDDNPMDSKLKAFNTLYATNHKFYGYMDYFLSLPADTDNRGLIDYQLKAEVIPCSRSKLKCDLHLFKYSRQDSAGQKNLGTEVDLTLDLNLRKTVVNVIGLSVFSPSEVFNRTRGRRTTWWLYHMLTVSF